MPEIFQNTEVPAWLRDVAKPVDGEKLGEITGGLISSILTSGMKAKQTNEAKSKEYADRGQNMPDSERVNWLQEIGPGFRDNLNRLKDPLWDQHIAQAQLGIAQTKLQMDQQSLAIQAQTKSIADTDADQKSMAEWLAKYPQVSDRENAPAPNLKSKQFQQFYEGVKRADSQSAVQKSIQNDIQQFNKDLTAVDAKTRSQIRGMRSNPDGSPSPQQIDALSLTVEAQKQEEANKAAQAEIQAAQSGMEKKTEVTTDSKGTKIKTTFSPPKAKGHWETDPNTGEYVWITPYGRMEPEAGKLTANQAETTIKYFENLARTYDASDKDTMRPYFQLQADAWKRWAAKRFTGMPFNVAPPSDTATNTTPSGLKYGIKGP